MDNSIKKMKDLYTFFFDITLTQSITLTESIPTWKLCFYTTEEDNYEMGENNLIHLDSITFKLVSVYSNKEKDNIRTNNTPFLLLPSLIEWFNIHEWYLTSHLMRYVFIDNNYNHIELSNSIDGGIVKGL